MSSDYVFCAEFVFSYLNKNLFILGTTVMAIYPQTTCFYKGVIKEQPSGGK